MVHDHLIGSLNVWGVGGVSFNIRGRGLLRLAARKSLHFVGCLVLTCRVPQTSLLS